MILPRKRVYRLAVIMLVALLGVTSVSAQEPTYLRVNDIAWSPDGKLLAVATVNGVSVYDMNMKGMPRLWSADVSEWMNVIVFSPSGQLLVAGTQRPVSEAGVGMVYIWNSQTGELTRSFQGNESGVYALAFNLDGTQLAGGGGEWWIPAFGYIRVWNVETGGEISLLRINGHGGIVQAMAYSPDGRWFVYNTENGGTTFVDAETWTSAAVIYDTRTDTILFDPLESPSAHVWLGRNRADEWELRELPEIHLVQVNTGFQAYPKFDASNDAITIGSTATRYVSATNDGVLRAGMFDRSGDILVHVQDGIHFRKAVFNPDETQVALVGETNSDWRRQNPHSDQVTVWTLASGEYRTLNLYQ